MEGSKAPTAWSPWSVLGAPIARGAARDPVGLFVVPLLLHLPLFSISAVQTAYLDPAEGWESADLGKLSLIAVAMVAGIFLACVAQGLVIRRTAAVLSGEASPLESDFRLAVRRSLVYFVVTFLLLLVVSAGLLALVLPGIVALYFWSFAPIASVLERAGVAASLKRSRRAVRGKPGRWAASAAILLVVYSLASWGVFAAAALLGELQAEGATVLVEVTNAVALQIVSLGILIAWTALYLDMRGGADLAEGKHPLGVAGADPVAATEPDLRTRAANLFE